MVARRVPMNLLGVLSLAATTVACSGERLAPGDIVDASVDATEDAAVETPDSTVDASFVVPATTPECERWFDTLSARRFACSNVALPAARLADLRDAFVRSCAFSEVAPGSTFDRAWIDRCAAVVETTRCDALEYAFWDGASLPRPTLSPPWPAGCEPPVGTRPVGAFCLVDAQCATGWCGATSTDTCGPCLAVRGEGDWCGGVSNRCVAGTVCDYADEICKRLPTTEGAPCVSGTCGLGFFCDPVASKCRRLRGEGGACWSDGDCAEGWACVGIRCRARTATLGKVCSAPCVLGLFCVDDHCAAPSFVPNEESCATPGVLCKDGSCSPRGDDYPRLMCTADWATGCAHGRDCSFAGACTWHR